MTQEKIKKLKKDLRSYVDMYADTMNKTRLAERFIDDTGTPLGVPSIRRYISLMMEADESFDEDAKDVDDVFKPDDNEDDSVNKQEEDDENDEKENTEEVKDEELVGLTYKKIHYKIPRSTIDRAICAYSRNGLNLTSAATQSLLDLDSNAFKAIVGGFDVNKESAPYSIYSEEILTEEELYDELSDNISYLLDRLQENDGSVVPPLVRAYKKHLLLIQHDDLKFKALVKGIEEELKGLNIQSRWTEPDLKGTGQRIHLIIPDMHIGLYQENYSLAIVKEKLNKIAGLMPDDAIVHVHFLGDIIHSVTGLNHKDMWKSMEPGVHGAAAIIEPFKLLAEFLLAIPGLVKVNMVGGELIAPLKCV